MTYKVPTLTNSTPRPDYLRERLGSTWGPLESIRVAYARTRALPGQFLGDQKPSLTTFQLRDVTAWVRLEIINGQRMILCFRPALAECGEPVMVVTNLLSVAKGCTSVPTARAARLRFNHQFYYSGRGVVAAKKRPPVFTLSRSLCKYFWGSASLVQGSCSHIR